MASKFLIFSLLVSFQVLTSTLADETGFVGTVNPKELGLHKTRKFSHFKFFFHERFTGSNATAVTIVPPLTNYSTTSFGLVGITDNALTVGSDPNTKVVGRIEGLYAGTSQTEFNLLLVVNFVLTEGKYNGSSIAVLGRNRISLKVRELPVIGGSGVFKFARGYAETSTLYLDANRSAVEYNIYVSHY
ncbi:Plant disease resistance response protein [Vigna unguiculata]|uniref:Dirigent protein n=1 Tax=Vigna unguiculata TaxID=3917 RepID=A0A4D6MPE2_VIGUN|nr:Plant disease resistance response protein [Vigna unguiculata]